MSSVRTLLGMLIATALGAPLSAASFPDGFEERTVVAGLTGATAMEVAPDGRVFVCEQTGTLRVVKHDRLLPEPFLAVAVDSSWERGLLGVALDPEFPAQPFVYVTYVVAKPYPHHRVSRFTAAGDRAVPGSEAILFAGDDQNQFGGSVKNGHQGGATHFGKDGKLYVALGDQTAGAPAQSFTALQGKILRLNKDGSIPTDNPFSTTATGKYRAIWALGLRNPFTFAVQPGTGRMLINDVGGANEEVNEGVAGANYGWPTVDHGPRHDPRFRDPVHWYKESSITGGTFYNPPAVRFPREYVGKYFFNDYKAGWIKTLDPDHPERVAVFATGLQTRGVVDLKVEADGSLLLLNRNAWVNDKDFRPGTGSLVRVRYTGVSGPPRIAEHPRPQTVPTGVTAYFRVAADGRGPLRYQWQRDGRDLPGATTATLLIRSAQPADGGALFRCVVANAAGSVTTDPASLTVTPSHDRAGREPAVAVVMPPLPEGVPPRLSQTGVFASLADLRPNPGVLPYDVIAPLWSDGAAKRRWVAVPPGARIGFSPDGEWSFPAGTVFVKHFELPTDAADPARPRRLETRLLVVDGTGLGYGVTYRWRPDGSDADLLTTGQSETVTVRAADGVRSQTWYYPSPADCLTCHTAAAKFVLGPKTRQLNRDFTYPDGTTDNQLRRWSALALFDPPPDESRLGDLPRLAALDDHSAPPSLQARSYLDANCAHCHRPGNPIRATFDARFNAPAAGPIDAPAVSDSLGLREPRVIAPGHPERSMALHRMMRTDGFRMPPLASNVADRAALEVLGQWVAGLPALHRKDP
jgi:uncharacterized repeat protein (TIGR03806 family)